MRNGAASRYNGGGCHRGTKQGKDWVTAMQIPVLIEPVAGNGYRARGGEPLALSAEGNTPDEALGKLRQLLESRLSAGAYLVALDMEPSDNPWQQFAGMFKDDPMFEEVVQIMAEQRREADLDPEYL